MTFLVTRESGENLPVKVHDEEEHRNETDTYACEGRSFLLQCRPKKDSEEIQQKVREGGRGKEFLDQA